MSGEEERTFQIVEVQPGDLDSIYAIETETFVSDAWSRELLQSELVAPHRHYIVATLPGRTIAGYAGLLSPRGSGEGDVQTIAVHSDYRGLGLGRALMNTLITEAIARGNTALFLEVRKDNPVAIALYTSLGFELIAERPKYYQPDGVDALVMRKRLDGSAATPAEREGAR